MPIDFDKRHKDTSERKAVRKQNIEILRDFILRHLKTYEEALESQGWNVMVGDDFESKSAASSESPMVWIQIDKDDAHPMPQYACAITYHCSNGKISSQIWEIINRNPIPKSRDGCEVDRDECTQIFQRTLDECLGRIEKQLLKDS